MAIVGNTAVVTGRDRARNAIAAGQLGVSILDSASAQRNQKLARENLQNKDAFTELDLQVKNIYNQFGPEAFQEKIEVDENFDGDKFQDENGRWYTNNPHFAETQQLLRGAGMAFTKSTRGDPNAYMAAMLNAPASPEQRTAWMANMGMLYAQERQQQQQGQPPAPPVQASTNVQQGDRPLPPPSPAQQNNMPSMPISGSTYVPLGERQPEAAIGYALTDGKQDAQDWVPNVPEQGGRSLLAENAQGLPDRAAPSPKALPAQEEQLFNSYQNELVQASRISDPSVRASVLASLQARNPAWYQALTGVGGQEVLGTEPKRQSIVANVLQRIGIGKKDSDKETVFTNRARGSGKTDMTEAELAEHERKTGDVHFPALIGVKEGVVNARAMDAGGREIVRKLNDQFPIFAEGYAGPMTGAGDVPVMGPEQNMPPAPQARTVLPGGTMGQPRQDMPPAPETPDPSVEMPSLARDVEDIIGPAERKPFEPSKTAAKLKAQFDDAIIKGQDKKAAAIQQARIADEVRTLKAYVHNPAVTSHNKRVRENMLKFALNANDEELAYYGFDKSLKQRQDAAKFEEEKLQNAANRDYMTATSAATRRSAEYTNAQIKLIQAQEKKELALADYQRWRMENSPLQNSEAAMDFLKENMKLYKNHDDFVKGLENSPSLQMLMDLIAEDMGISGGWKAAKSNPSIFESVNRWVANKLNPPTYGTYGAPPPASVQGPQFDNEEAARKIIQTIGL